MALSEFTLIQRYFSRTGTSRADVELGVGDDAAVIRVPEHASTAVGTGLLVEGRHFGTDTPPESLGHKCLAVSLSQLAAAGAEPAWFTLALTWPHADPYWLEAFSRGLHTLATRHQMQLVGGDTTRGPGQILTHAHGLVPAGQALQRTGAQAGDLIYVTGDLGLAGLALLAEQQEVRLSAAHRREARRRLYWPEPRVAAGLALRGLASAVTDLPDGLASGLSGILGASGVGATLQAELLPVSPALAEHLDAAGGWVLPLTAGEDYELCFTLPSARQAELEARFAGVDPACTWIGVIDRTPGLRCLQADGTDIAPGMP